MARSSVVRCYRKNPEKVKELEASLRSDFPDLWVGFWGKKVFIRGSFPVTANGVVIDRYKIRMELPEDYPVSPPVVFEISNRIPRTTERHVNQDGSVCTFLPDAAWDSASDISVLDFLKGPVNDFFVWQKEVEYFGHPSVEAWQHGALGIIDYYAEELGTNNIDVIMTLLDYLQREPKGHWLCFCGSGKKIRACHLAKLQELRDKIPPSRARKSFEMVRDHRLASGPGSGSVPNATNKAR